MKHLKTYSQLNESKVYDILNSLLDKFSEKLDTKKLAGLILPNKDVLLPYYSKYVKNGAIDVDAIYSDFSRFNFKANEGYGDPVDYADDKNNHPVLRFLYKLFVRWPKNFIKGVWEFFYDTVVETWSDSKIMSILAGVMWIGTAILVYLLGYVTYTVIEHSISGLESGKVVEEKFEPGHYELHSHTIIVGKVVSSYTTNDWVPDTWFVEVVGENGRKEVWSTYNQSVGRNTKIGQEVINDNDWTWSETE